MKKRLFIGIIVMAMTFSGCGSTNHEVEVEKEPVFTEE